MNDLKRRITMNEAHQEDVTSFQDQQKKIHGTKR
jgi:hypothetical protein